MSDELAVKRGELALARARFEALVVLVEHCRADALPGEAALLAGLETILTSKLGADGVLERGDGGMK